MKNKIASLLLGLLLSLGLAAQGSDGERGFDCEHLLSQQTVLDEFEKQNLGFTFLKDVSLASGNSVGSLTSDSYYEFSFMDIVVDPIIYGSIDILGIIPGIDYFADGAGLLYASIRLDGHQAVLYSASLAIPFVGAAGIKAISKSYAYFAKKINENTLSIVVKQWDETSTGWTKISNDVPYTESNKATIKNTLEAKKAEIDEGIVKEVVQGAGNLLTKRTNWLNNLKSQHGTFDISNFKPQGLNAIDVPSTTYSEMLGEYSTAIDNATKQGYLNGLIKSGSTVPVKKTFNVGDELYKIVVKDATVNTTTPFFMTKAEFEALETAVDIEQKLGLPLISHAVEYDVFKITATQPAKAFENTIANTLEKTYTTTGGGKQMLVIDRSKWSPAVKVKTIMPNQ